MAKIIVEIDMGDDRDAEALKKHIEDNREDYFPVGGNFIAIDSAELKKDPTDDSFYLFKLMGIIDSNV